MPVRAAARAAAVVLVAVWTLSLFGVATAPAAAAHARDTAVATNFVSEVRGLSGPDPEAPVGTRPGGGDALRPSAAGGSPAGPLPSGISARIIGSDALLELRNDTADEVMILGYEGEPYLRIGPEGVWRNSRSPATALNERRDGSSPVPPAADATAAPDWERLSSSPAHAWHDHRIHWMAATRPAQVKADPDADVTLYDWVVPLRIDGRAHALVGTLRWVPGPSVPGWLAAAAASGLLVVALLRRRGRGAAVGGVAALVAVVAVGNGIAAIGNLLTLPLTAGELAVSGARPLLLAVAAIGAARHGRRGNVSALLVAVGATALQALPLLPVLSASQTTNVVPAAVVRAVVAAAAVIALPTVAAMLPDIGRPRPAPVH